MESSLQNLRVGAALQLQVAGDANARRYTVKVVGYVPGVSLLVTTPEIDGKVQIIRDGQMFNARVLQGESAMAFSSRVLSSCATPFPYLHLSYPREVETIVVRNAQRTMANIPVLARNTKDPDESGYQHDAVLEDLSTTGARLTSRRPLGSTGDNLYLIFDIQVAGGKDMLGIFAEIRSCKPNEEGDDIEFFHGLRFRSLIRIQKLLIHSWVMERLVDHHSTTD